jgi:hypothetical protein
MRLIVGTFFIAIAGCGTLEKQANLVNPGYTRDQVMAIMGQPKDRQFNGSAEAWQYCQTGAGFGFHDYRVVWFRDGQVIGMNSYKSTRPATSCEADFQPVVWENAPDRVVEVRQR